MNSTFKLRPDQEAILNYQGGRLGIAAVPGSGKTFTLSLLAASLIAQGVLEDDQEILVVTLVNSAVDNFYQRVSTFVKQHNLLPNLGYRVRTLHGLAHDIVRERPELAGLDNNFNIIDERESESIIDGAVQAWLRANPDTLDFYLKSDLEEYQLSRVETDYMPALVKDIATSFIRFAKDTQATAERLEERLEEIAMPLPLARMGTSLYVDYQRALAYRGAVDFDDLIRLALSVLHYDDELLTRLRNRWPYILEDEAQDSSRLQEEILKLLSGADGNWVRVGDPNQAIYETFTTANPKYLINFIQDPFVGKGKLSISGRSTKSIINLANYLVEWTQTSHPTLEVRDALHGPNDIIPAPVDDPQPNPPDDPHKIILHRKKFNPAEEIQAVARSIKRWLVDNSSATVAVLAPRNTRAFELVDEFRRQEIPYIDSLLRSSTTTRSSAGALGNILRYLADPQSPSKLSKAYMVYHRAELEDEQNSVWVRETAELINKCRFIEEFIWPKPGKDWLQDTNLSATSPDIFGDLTQFRELVRRWQSSVLLPVDQILLSLAQDLLSQPAELAIAHKLAVMLRTASEVHPAWRMPELTEELAVIARNERRFLGFAEDDTGFDPDRYPGKVVVSTIHKAKGLEWDRVYLMSVNNYDFPSGMQGDSYMPEKWFLRDQLNLEAEAISQLNLLISSEPNEWYQEGTASQIARLDYIRERLRLLYVGITRARKELVITWNTGRRNEAYPAAALVALQEFWSTQHPAFEESN
jgi:DNA helicase-2/ATP-dependent DNA helicase PcrA